MKFNESIEKYLARGTSIDEKMVSKEKVKNVTKYDVIRRIVSALGSAIRAESDEKENKRGSRVSDAPPELDFDTMAMKMLNDSFNSVAEAATTLSKVDSAVLAPGQSRDKYRKEKQQELDERIQEFNKALEVSLPHLKSIYTNLRLKSKVASERMATIEDLSHKYYDENYYDKNYKKDKSLLCAHLLSDLDNIKISLQKRLRNMSDPNLEDYRKAYQQLPWVKKQFESQKNPSDKEISLIKNIIRDAMSAQLLTNSPGVEDDIDVIINKISSREALLNLIENVIPDSIKESHSDKLQKHAFDLKKQLTLLKNIYFDFFILAKDKPTFNEKERKLIAELDQELLKILQFTTKIYPAQVSWPVEFTALVEQFSKQLDLDTNTLEKEKDFASKRGHYRTTKGLTELGQGSRSSTSSSVRSPTTPHSPFSPSSRRSPTTPHSPFSPVMKSSGGIEPFEVPSTESPLNSQTPLTNASTPSSVASIPEIPENNEDRKEVTRDKDPIKLARGKIRSERAQRVLGGHEGPLPVDPKPEQPRFDRLPPSHPDYRSPPPPDYKAPSPPKTAIKSSTQAYFNKPSIQPTQKKDETHDPVMKKSSSKSKP